MYRVSAQGVDERMINVCYYYYYFVVIIIIVVVIIIKNEGEGPKHKQTPDRQTDYLYHGNSGLLPNLKPKPIHRVTYCCCVQASIGHLSFIHVLRVRFLCTDIFRCEW